MVLRKEISPYLRLALRSGRGKLTCPPLVFQEAGAAEQRRCARRGAAAVPPTHCPADHEGECAGTLCRPWTRALAQGPVLGAEAGEERRCQRSGCGLFLAAAVGGFWSSARGALRARPALPLLPRDAVRVRSPSAALPLMNPRAPRRAAAGQHGADSVSPRAGAAGGV